MCRYLNPFLPHPLTFQPVQIRLQISDLLLLLILVADCTCTQKELDYPSLFWGHYAMGDSMPWGGGIMLFYTNYQIFQTAQKDLHPWSRHSTPTSSWWLQLCLPQPEFIHCWMDDSLPVQVTSSNQILASVGAYVSPIVKTSRAPLC